VGGGVQPDQRARRPHRGRDRAVLPAVARRDPGRGPGNGAVPGRQPLLHRFYTGNPARDEGRYRLLADQLEIYREHGASWSLWTYKDIGLQGLVYASGDSPYIRRIAPVLEKKARLGADAWGSLDTGVRHILDPIEQTFAEEFGDFEPFPWGQRSWVHTLVRHVLLAEPLVAEFGRCFAGVDPEEAEELADSFAFEACARRERLADLLAGT
jgi:endoglucanase